MIEELLQQDRELRRGKIISETAKISWSELQRFFAAGHVMLVAAEVDLVDVAIALEEDDSEKVKIWIETGQLAAVSDEQAKDWVAGDTTLWAVVVKPWVLVQTLPCVS